ncbi:SDR family oxidoreductase [Altererythrobacter sp. RZ02]|uniref:SDR family oxidoreductase n=1 Tax=Pontixanthobacter rizhaonensis TaxID=2730337 RepID=A0A848QLK0_9SPHN|nr:SDR family oxidoreductase [Pontixanthobacter rizhaonensis]NMW31709.1 SDR family oxidoreductase [Pontixanthobacter rizhaonensis]
MNRPAVLITGAAKRIGAEIARRFDSAGWHVIIHYGNSATEAEALVAELASAEAIHCDLADTDAAVAMIVSLAKRLPDWRALINSASIFRYDDATNLDRSTYNRSMIINAKTPARMAQAYLAHAIAPGGRRVIHVTDQKLENSNPDFFSYTMSKHALNATIEMLRDGAASGQDRVYGVAPGAILASHDQTDDETDASHVLNLLERKTDASEIADAMLFLTEGHLASGETLFIDSGQHLLNQPRDVIYLARGDQ